MNDEFLNNVNALPPEFLQTPASVLVKNRVSVVGVIFLKNHILLLRRSAQLNSHPNQIGLPGGFVEESDVSLEAAMQRELQEELLLSTKDISSLEIKGFLPAQLSLSGKTVLPILASWDRSINLKQFNKSEVSEIFVVEDRFFRRDTRKEFRFNIFGIWRESSLYETPNCRVWGLTARIIDTLNGSLLNV